jgi:hypothetical protein
MRTAVFIASELIIAQQRPDTWIVLALALSVLTQVMNRRRLALWTAVLMG